MASLSPDLGRRELTFADKLRGLQWGLVLLVAAISGIGFAMLYSAANGSLQPWASRQMTRFAIAFAPMLLVPARFFHSLSGENVVRIPYIIPPVLLIIIPAVLVLKQPDLGTALLLLVSGAALCFLGGVRLRLFAAAGLAAAVAAPFAWRMLRDYQKTRLYTFLDPDQDPLGAGYHIMQSKIALGSGGLFGKGFLLGTQTHLSFLPEKQTDFIFTMLAEEFGLVGGLVLLALYIVVIGYAFAITLRSRNQFGRLLGLGLATNFFLYAFINTAMVMGLIPVVGVPLPLISYGGTAMITMMLGFGLVMNVGIHRDVRISRLGESQL